MTLEKIDEVPWAINSIQARKVVLRSQGSVFDFVPLSKKCYLDTEVYCVLSLTRWLVLAKHLNLKFSNANISVIFITD